MASPLGDKRFDQKSSNEESSNEESSNKGSCSEELSGEESPEKMHSKETTPEENPTENKLAGFKQDASKLPAKASQFDDVVHNIQRYRKNDHGRQRICRSVLGGQRQHNRQDGRPSHQSFVKKEAQNFKPASSKYHCGAFVEHCSNDDDGRLRENFLLGMEAS
jgi:hypothetical protein